MIDYLKPYFFELVKQVAKENNMEIYVVGGYVRDCLLQRDSKDIDFVVLGDGIEAATQLSQLLQGNPQVHYFKNFGTAQINTEEGWQLEFVGARKESYHPDSRKPQVSSGTLEDDQKRRDFTINALAISLNTNNFGELIDPFDGVADLQQQTIRTPLEPDITFSDDPLRMMRAIRFATQLGFSILPETLESIAKNAARIEIVSMERVSDELNKIVAADKPSIGFKLLFDSGLLHKFFPEMVALQGVEIIDGLGHKDNFYHTLQVLDNVSLESDDLWLRWSAILHDIAKPRTKKFEPGHGWTFHGHEDRGARMVKPLFRKLRLPLNEKMRFVEKMVELHLRPIVLAKEEVTDSAVRRLIVDAGEDVDSLLLLCKADITSKNEVKVKKYLNNLKLVKQKIIDVTERDKLANWQPPINGDHIMESFVIEKGKQIGDLKNCIREAVLEGLIPNEFEAAYQFMLIKGSEMGLKPKSLSKNN